MNHVTPARKAQAGHKLNLPSTCSKLLTLPSQAEKSKVAYRKAACKDSKPFWVFLGGSHTRKELQNLKGQNYPLYCTTVANAHKLETHSWVQEESNI